MSRKCISALLSNWSFSFSEARTSFRRISVYGGFDALTTGIKRKFVHLQIRFWTVTFYRRSSRSIHLKWSTDKPYDAHSTDKNKSDPRSINRHYWYFSYFQHNKRSCLLAKRHITLQFCCNGEIRFCLYASEGNVEIERESTRLYSPITPTELFASFWCL